MRRAAVFLITLPLLAGGCRLISGEVACTRDRDCPQDANISYCDYEGDAGVGTCVAVDPNPVSDDGGGFDLDAGFLTPNRDGGADGGGPPGFP